METSRPFTTFASRTIVLSEQNIPGKCVLYVMSRDQRVDANHALLAAQAYALQRKLPLAVAFCLSPRKGHRAREHYYFMLEGLEKLEVKLGSLGIPLMLLIGPAFNSLSSVLHHVQPEAVFFDFSPLQSPRKLQKRIAQLCIKSGTGAYVIDSHNIIPVWQTSPKLEVGAYTIRPKIHKIIESYPFYRHHSHILIHGPAP